MRIKLDENLPESLLASLAELGHDVDNERLEGLVGRVGEVFPVDVLSRNRANRASQFWRLPAGLGGRTPLSFATTRPWLVMITSSPCSTNRTSRNQSLGTCSPVPTSPSYPD